MTARSLTVKKSRNSAPDLESAGQSLPVRRLQPGLPLAGPHPVEFRLTDWCTSVRLLSDIQVEDDLHGGYFYSPNLSRDPPPAFPRSDSSSFPSAAAYSTAASGSWANAHAVSVVISALSAMILIARRAAACISCRSCDVGRGRSRLCVPNPEGPFAIFSTQLRGRGRSCASSSPPESSAVSIASPSRR